MKKQFHRGAIQNYKLKCIVSGIGLLQEQQIFMKGMIIIAFAHIVLHDSNYQYL